MLPSQTVSETVSQILIWKFSER